MKRYLFPVMILVFFCSVVVAAPKAAAPPLFTNQNETLRIPLRISDCRAIMGTFVTSDGSLKVYTEKDVVDFAKDKQATEGDKWIYAFNGDIPKDKSGKYSPGLSGNDMFIRFKKGLNETITIQWKPLEGETIDSLKKSLEAVIAKEASEPTKPGMGKVRKAEMGGFTAVNATYMVDAATVNMWFVLASYLDRVYIVSFWRTTTVDPPEFRAVKEGIVFFEPLTELK